MTDPMKLEIIPRNRITLHISVYQGGCTVYLIARILSPFHIMPLPV
jgi:hypothetical protein